MMSRQNPRQSLRHRVDAFLHQHPPVQSVDEPEEESVEQIFALIQKAEGELEVARARVERLKWELEKARS